MLSNNNNYYCKNDKNPWEEIHWLFPMKQVFLVLVTVLFLCLLQTQATLTTNDIVINKLTQILLYLRQGTRGGKKVKKKEKGKSTYM